MHTVEALSAAVLWQQRNGRGMEHCSVRSTPDATFIDGVVVMQDDAGAPFRIAYQVRCERSWETREVSVHAHEGGQTRYVTLQADSAGRWIVDGKERPDLEGCTDVDLGFTPSTNTLPIQRLRLAARQSATIDAAWVRFPGLAVTRTPQRYTRTGDHTYRYENLTTGFTAEIEVDERGLALSYPPAWERVPSAASIQEVLLSPGPSPDLGNAADLYAWLIGSWDLEAVDYDADGARRTSEGEWHFSWALEGRAVQDVFIVPNRRTRSALTTGAKGNRYGTTIRFYDRASGDWLITWFNPVTGAVNRLSARREGDQIVQRGTDPDGTMRRWTFTDITPDRFRWVGEESSDKGTTWHTGAEFFVRRRMRAQPERR